MAVCNIWSLTLIIVSGLVSSGSADSGILFVPRGISPRAVVL